MVLHKKFFRRQMTEQEMAKKNLVYKIRTGSRMYGTVTPTSDDDYLGIFIPDEDYIIGTKRCEQVSSDTKLSGTTHNQKGDVDCTLYSLPKFFHLAQNNNPNIVEMFFAQENCVLFCNSFGKIIRENYSLFISKKAYHTFKGYAYSQKSKILTKNPIGHRADLVKKYGFDCKYASHLCRLLVEGHQLLVEGKLTFPLAQNCLVTDVKEGKYTIDEVLKKAEELEKLVDLAYTTSSLQFAADENAINELQKKMLKDFWRY